MTRRGPTVNAANPVPIGDDILLTASYGIGAKPVPPGPRGATLSGKGMKFCPANTRRRLSTEKVVYGVDGRQDGGPVTLKCFDPQSRPACCGKAAPLSMPH
ncbi:MAG: hypothetical protein U0872_07480 [Planctomycetaceae bacterium]